MEVTKSQEAVHALKSAGGTEVVVRGRNFTNSGDLLCSFGGATSPAVWFSSTELRCSSPRHEIVGSRM